MSTIYISIPISGYDLEERIKVTERLRERLLADGWAVYSPLHKSGVPLDSPREIHMKEDIKMLLKSDAIFMAGEWQTASGCVLEREIAKQCGLQVIYELEIDRNYYGERIAENEL